MGVGESIPTSPALVLPESGGGGTGGGGPAEVLRQEGAEGHVLPRLDVPGGPVVEHHEAEDEVLRLEEGGGTVGQRSLTYGGLVSLRLDRSGSPKSHTIIIIIISIIS